MIKPVLLLAAAACVVLTAGCQLLPNNCDTVECGACPPPLNLKVTSSSGGAVENVTVANGASGTCSVDGDATSCVLNATGPGTWEFDLQAPGFQTTHVKQTVDAVPATGCCSCGYDAKLVDVTMQPE